VPHRLGGKPLPCYLRSGLGTKWHLRRGEPYWPSAMHLGCCRGAVRFWSRDPILFLWRWPSLSAKRVAPGMRSIFGASEKLADNLSRCAEGTPVPDLVRGVPFSTPPQGNWRVLPQRAEQAPHTATCSGRQHGTPRI